MAKKPRTVVVTLDNPLNVKQVDLIIRHKAKPGGGFPAAPVEVALAPVPGDPRSYHAFGVDVGNPNKKQHKVMLRVRVTPKTGKAYYIDGRSPDHDGKDT